MHIAYRKIHYRISPSTTKTHTKTSPKKTEKIYKTIPKTMKNLLSFLYIFFSSLLDMIVTV